MLERVLERKRTLVRMMDDDVIERFLEDSEWCYISLVKMLLEPFKDMQQYMEGQKYVTVSYVPQFLWKIRLTLKDYLYVLTLEREEVIDTSKIKQIKEEVYSKLFSLSSDDRETMANTVESMVKVFEARFGENEATMFNIDEPLQGPRSQRKGIPVTTLLAMCVDPRTKELKGIPKSRRNEIWDKLHLVMCEVEKESRCRVQLMILIWICLMEKVLH